MFTARPLCPSIADISETWRHFGFVPIVLQKSPSGLCEIEICNYRIEASVHLNRCCVYTADLESMFPAEMLKRLLQHNLPEPDIMSFAGSGRKRRLPLSLNDESPRWLVGSSRPQATDPVHLTLAG